ncbi:M15 family metallopeptidase [Kribbella sp. NPDC051770]|uniref:M15 family metallopeptidase n=1 Tax=Kribbella sp. NPDC051770 TaxID=3155413 RepID=UPI00342ECAB4
MTADELVATRKKERRLTVCTAVALLTAVGAFTAAACGTLSSAQDSAPSSAAGTTNGSAPGDFDPGEGSGDPGDHDGPARAADGVLPDNASPFDLSLPGIAKLDPALRAAVQQAAKAMEANGIKLHVTTGWRSKAYQRQLLEDGIKKYGSLEKAREFVSTPEESHHVTGHAVDVGPTDADDWLIRKGSRFGLCQTLSNEMWHFELVVKPGEDCPQPKATASSQ